MESSQPDPNFVLESLTADTFTPPSIHHETLVSGSTYSHFSPVPPSLLAPLPSESSPSPLGPPCALGVDEAGRGPVLGPMVYGCFYLPIPLSTPLLSTEHHFDDSKVLTPAFRSSLMETLCTPSSSLHDSCGWAVTLLSARSISAGMLHSTSMYNLNAQAMDATIALIQGVYARGVNVKEIYIDTIGQPAAYQKKLERVFPGVSITVAKKADSLYPCVSAASVCAKVTRDTALEVLYEACVAAEGTDMQVDGDEPDWGSGYPSDVRCTSWLKRNMDPVFGWGSECRFSWGTAKDLLDVKGLAAGVVWPVEDDDEGRRLTDFFAAEGEERDGGELETWFGTRVAAEVF